MQGTGSSIRPFQITSAEQLNALATYVNNGNGNSTLSHISGEEALGGLVGGSMYATVTNIYFTGTINGSSNDSVCLVGKEKK
jgi:hypothetical protein